VGRFGKAIDAARRARGAALMGVLNVTPDSFFDGGRFCSVNAAAAHFARLVGEGADIVDVGAESSRPGAARVEPAEQLARLEPVVRAGVAQGSALVSVDTTSPEVADRVLDWGAHAVNDVSCLRDPELARVAARHGAALVIMHSRGALGSMAGFSQYPDDAYHDVVEDVLMEWQAARDRAVRFGMSPDDVLFDPGIGFAKNARHSFEVVRRLSELLRAGARLVVGPSRKSFIAAVDATPPEGRLGGTIAACLLCAQRGASVLRVHDVGAVRQALAVAAACGASRLEVDGV
jgi:dihydropteroate synthase